MPEWLEYLIVIALVWPFAGWFAKWWNGEE
jgi:hypothetical protein